MSEASCLFWEGMVSSQLAWRDAVPPVPLQLCDGFGVKSPQPQPCAAAFTTPLAQRRLLCPQSEVQSAVRAPCTTHTPLHGASSLHNPQGQGQHSSGSWVPRCVSRQANSSPSGVAT